MVNKTRPEPPPTPSSKSLGLSEFPPNAIIRVGSDNKKCFEKCTSARDCYGYCLQTQGPEKAEGLQAWCLVTVEGVSKDRLFSALLKVRPPGPQSSGTV